MASEKQKRKAKHNFLWNGNKGGLMKRIFHFTKANRNELKRETEEMIDEEMMRDEKDS